MDSGLLLVGSRPGSAEPPRAFSRTFQVQTPASPKSRASVSKYQERLFSGPGSQTYSSPDGRSPAAKARSRSESPAPQRKTDRSPRPCTPKRGSQRTAPSYVDETLFGDRPMEADFPAPWDDGKKTVFVMDATDYKLQQKLKEQRARSAKDTAPGKRGSPLVASHTVLKSHNSRQKAAGRTSFKPSHVDELLFGSENPNASSGPSWQTAPPLPTGPEHDPLNTGRMSVSGTRPPSREGRPPSPGRPASSRSQRSPSPAARPGSAGKRGGRDRHNPSFVDESLFGPRPAEADWPAPWEDLEAEKKRGRPLLFDSSDYRVTIHHGNSRPSSARSNSKSRPSSAKGSQQKPAPWR